MTWRIACLFAGILLVAACGSREVLQGRPANVPVDVDLSGNWLIRPDQSDGWRRLREAIRATDGIRDRDMYRTQAPGRRGSSNGRAKGGLVFVFLETGESLKVTQTADGLFISFDRAVVEEFRFGENRMVTVGQVEGQRVTGWVDDTLVVETLDRNSMKLTERFRLTEGGDVLERTIVLRSRQGDVETVRQVFDRETS